MPMSRPPYSRNGGPPQQSKPVSLFQAEGLPPQTRFAGYQPAARGPRYQPPEHNPSMLNNAPAHHRPPYRSVSAGKDEGDSKPYRSLPGLCSPLAPREAAVSSQCSRDLHPLTPVRLAAEAARRATNNSIADDASGSPGTLSLCTLYTALLVEAHAAADGLSHCDLGLVTGHEHLHLWQRLQHHFVLCV